MRSVPILFLALTTVGCASAVTPLSGDASPGSDASVDVAPPTCTAGRSSAPTISGGAAALATCPDARSTSPQPANAPHIRGFTVSAPCGCATGISVELDVTDPDTPRDALRTCMLVMNCAATSNEGTATGASFSTGCQGAGGGSWLITVVDPQGNHDSVGGFVESASGDPLRCAAHSSVCLDSIPTSSVEGANRGCE